jgi:hypothetical protein
MKSRSLAWGTLTASVLLLAAPAVTTVHAAEPLACAKEQLAYLDAEDTLVSADDDAQRAQADLDRAASDVNVLQQTADHINDLSLAMDPFVEMYSNNQQLRKERNGVITAAGDARKAQQTGDAAAVADAADRAVAAAYRFDQAAPDEAKRMTFLYDRFSGLVREVHDDAGEARKATSAKEYDAAKNKAEQAQKDARSAHDATPAARDALKACLKKVSA